MASEILIFETLDYVEQIVSLIDIGMGVFRGLRLIEEHEFSFAKSQASPFL